MEDGRVFKVLLVDHRSADDSLIQRLLAEPSENCFQFNRVSTYEEAIYLVRFKQWDAVLVNQDFGSHPGIELIHHIRLWSRQIPLILLSDAYDDQLEYKARKVGASDYYTKGSITLSVLNALIAANPNRPTGKRRTIVLPRLLRFWGQRVPHHSESQ